VQNAVPLNIIQNHGKVQDASILTLGGLMTELSKLHQREDGEMLNAMLELVSMVSERLRRKNFMIN
jgi:hypothetical protein